MSSVQAPPHISVSRPTEDVVPPPAYTSSTLSRSRSQSSLSSQTASLPGYDDATATASPALSPEDVDFYPTNAFQIQTPGKGWFSSFGPPRPDPIPIYAVEPSSNADYCAVDFTPKYVSLRAARRSGNCVLIHGSDFPEVYSPSSSSSNPHISSEAHALTSTLYRFGCGRAPQVRVYPGNDGPDAFTAFENMTAAKHARSNSETEAWALDSAGAGETPAFTFDVPEKTTTNTSSANKPFTAPLNPVSALSRAIRFATPQGTFQWRYSTRPERKSFGAHSLLVLEQLVPLPETSDAPPKKGEGHIRVPMGFFVRSQETRSPGSGRSTAGNGGRLLLDLRSWDGTTADQKGLKNGIVNEKRRLMASDTAGADAEAVERVAIATCLAMLKKEVDRRRLHQALIFSAAVGGGGGP